MTHRVNWDDLRFVLAVADQGSVASAARLLGVNHTTVLRRTHAFEEANKIRLFERLPTGYVLTAEGEQLVVAARSIDDTVAALERRIAGRDLKLEGVIRVTTTDTFMNSVLPRHLADFRRQHPRITIELALTNSRLNLTKRDADVAIRPARELPTPLVGKRVADVGFAIYAAKTYLRTHPADPLAAGHAWLAGDELLANSPVASWMRRHVPDVEIAFRADSFVALHHAAAAGLGLAALPCCLGDAEPELSRLDAPTDDLETGLWVLTHLDLSKAARIRAFMEHMETALNKERRRLKGVPARAR
ncbi:MAG: LysR family transcriptional regulator [Alphaproteobacteria bacterium]|nr:LysR family transcriptional regulator [Alphaproteobacteria bacterium]